MTMLVLQAIYHSLPDHLYDRSLVDIQLTSQETHKQVGDRGAGYSLL